MTHVSSRPPVTRRPIAVAAMAIAVALCAAAALPDAQVPAKKALAIDDYARWRTITGEKLSGDGKWVAYVLRR